MRNHNLGDMIRGWFVGNFEPTALKTSDFEVGVKKYKAGEKEEWHVHKVATELTVIVSGSVRMNGKPYGEGDIITLEPGDGSDFEVIEDTVTCVVKVPSVAGDKYSREQISPK